MTQARVRFAETDAAGIVHYAQYLAYFEAGRADALRSAGLSSEMIVACSLHARLLEADLRYRAPARFDDLLDIYTWVVEASGSRFRFACEILRVLDRVVIATGETLHEWTDPNQACDSVPHWLFAALDQLRG
jgi:acyl-CoA thioester hydrolase